MGQAALTAVLTLLLGGTFVFAVVDASVRPAVQYRDAGFHKLLWLGLLVVTNVVAAAVYLIAVRPRLEHHRDVLYCSQRANSAA